MPNNRRRKTSSRHGKSKNANPVDKMIVNSLHSAARGDVVSCAADLGRQQPSWQLTQTPPKNFLKRIVWIQETTESSFTEGITGTFIEFPATFFLAALPRASTIATLYDQYCLYSAAVRVVPELGNAVPVSGTGMGTLGQLITALDYDSSNALGSWTNYQAIGSAQEYDAVIGKSYERYVKPTASLVTGGSNTTSNTGVAMSRVWLNSNSGNVPHFGVRIAAQGNNSQIPVVFRIIITVVVGMRNNF